MKKPFDANGNLRMSELSIQSPVTYSPTGSDNGPTGRGYLTESEELALRCSIVGALVELEKDWANETPHECWTVPKEVLRWAGNADFNKQENLEAIRAAAQLPYTLCEGNDAQTAALLMAWFRLAVDPHAESRRVTDLARNFFTEVHNISGYRRGE